jgi:Flp pilus assembly protein TadG
MTAFRPLRALARSGAERGTAAVELAILLPVLVLITLGIVDFGRVFYAYLSVANAAHQGAIYAARTTQLPSTTAVAAVAYGEAGGFLSAANSTVTVAAGCTTSTVRVVTVRVTHSFLPFAGLPRSGAIPVSATAAAPRPLPLVTEDPCP